MSLPTVSVIIPTYNRAHLIERALSSVLSQIGPEDEIIVIDDGSTDNTEDVVRGISDRIKYHRIENSGAGKARNVGIDLATRELIAFLDSDDEWFDGKLEIQRNLMSERQDILFCFSDIAITSSKGEIVHNFVINWHNDKRSWDEILGPAIPYNTIGKLPANIPDFNFHIGDMYVQTASAIYTVTSTTIVRKEAAGAALRFDEDAPMYEDWYCFGQLARAGNAAFLNVETAWQHSHRGFRITDADSLTLATQRLKLLDKVWGKDEDFMKEHSDLFHSLKQEQFQLKAAALIAFGRTGEAREYLAKLKTPPASLKFLAAMPNMCVKIIMSVRRFFLKMVGRAD